jgi:excisionase family DNA binding protein
MTRLLTADEVARQLQCSTDWIYERVRAGTFPAVRCGRLVRFDQQDVDRWVQLRKVNVAEGPA